ncbi:hypothetical protein [Aestuariivirga sp.]|uniref:hypothetical protein n=1 Tax=Aestuariivirga sp. TaxID=2650926 RepID=UPI003BACCC86
MIASKFDQLAGIRLCRETVPNEFGEIDHHDTPSRVVRVHVVSTTISEAAGSTIEGLITVRLRFIPGVMPGSSLTMNSCRYEIIEVQELGRRAFLELKAVRRP